MVEMTPYVPGCAWLPSGLLRVPCPSLAAHGGLVFRRPSEATPPLQSQDRGRDPLEEAPKGLESAAEGATLRGVQGEWDAVQGEILQGQ